MSTHKQKNDITKASILIVDDLARNQYTLSLILKKAGYEIQTAANGLEALESVQTALPDLILLDIMMPNMNGYQVCEYLKADKQTRDVPIIFISALNETEDKVKAFSIGGVDYITKPFQPEEVLARVKTHISLMQLQKQLQDANIQLAIQLDEVNAFAHTVAHDLTCFPHIDNI